MKNKKFKYIKNVVGWILIFLLGQSIGTVVGLNSMPRDQYELYLNDNLDFDVISEIVSNPMLLGGIIAVLLFVIINIIRKRLTACDTIKGITKEYLSLYKLEDRKSYILYFILGISINIVISFILTLITLFLSVSEADVEVSAMPQNLLMVILVAFAVPIMEEILFRNRIYSNLAAISPEGGRVLQAALFGVMHGLSIQGFYTFYISFLFLNENEYHNSLLPSILMHCGLNFVAAMSILLPSFSIYIFIIGCICCIITLINIKKVVHLRKQKLNYNNYFN